MKVLLWPFQNAKLKGINYLCIVAFAYTLSPATTMTITTTKKKNNNSHAEYSRRIRERKWAAHTRRVLLSCSCTEDLLLLLPVICLCAYIQLVCVFLDRSSEWVVNPVLDGAGLEDATLKRIRGSSIGRYVSQILNI